MKIAELFKIFETYGLDPSKYGLESELFGTTYHYKNGFSITRLKLRHDKDNPYETIPFTGTEDEFVAHWANRIDTYITYHRTDNYYKREMRFINLLASLLSEDPSFKPDNGSDDRCVSLKCDDEGEYIFYIRDNKKLVNNIYETCGFKYCNDDGIYECPLSLLLNKFDPEILIKSTKYPQKTLLECISHELVDHIEWYMTERFPYDSEATDYYGTFILLDSFLDYKIYNGDCYGIIYNSTNVDAPWEWVKINRHKDGDDVVHNTAATYISLEKK